MYSWQGVFLILGFTYATFLVLELCVQLYRIQQEQKAGGFSKEFLQMLRDMRDTKDEK